MKLGLFIILFVIIFGGSYIVTNKLNGTSAYVDEMAQLVKDNQDDVVLAFQPVRGVLSYCLS